MDETSTTVRAAKDSRGALGLISDFGGAVTFCLLIGGFVLKGTPRDIVLALSLGVITVYSVTVSFRMMRRLHSQEVANKRSSGLAAAQGRLNDAAEALAQATASMLAGRSHEVFPLEGARFAEALADAYTVITGRPCRVTVKEAYSERNAPDPGPFVRTCFRSRIASTAIPAPTEPQKLTDNTDFKEVTENRLPYWLSNNLPDELRRGYQNTNWPREMLQSEEFPYRSTIVWPIQRVVTEGAQPEVSLLGFLCLDSEREDAFDERFDVSPGSVFAHTLYSSMSLYRTARDRADQDRDEG